MAILLQTGGQAVAVSRFSFGGSIKAEAMAQEESFRIGNHRSVKKHKQKKIPQRGLGVAQLEKIRLEEQQKTFPNSHSFPPISLPSPSSSGSLAYNHSQDPIFSIPNLHPLSSSSPSPPPFPPTPPFIPLSWSNNEQYIRNVENFGIPIPHLHEPNAFRKQPTLVNLSPTSSSGVNLQMEPPSNQIYTNSDTPWPQEDRVVGIKRPWSFLNDSSSNCIPEHPNKIEFGKPTVRDACSFKTSQEINWKTPPEFDFRVKDNGSLDGAFLTLGPSSSSSSSNSRSKQSSLLSAECHDLYEYQTKPSQDALRGSTNGDLMPSLRFSAGERWSGLACHQFHHQHHLRHPYRCDLSQQYQYQAGDQFYSFLCPEPSARATEPEDERDADGTDEKASIDLSLKL
ncbi:hypothetical protein EJ110_NYTH20904 [Nymphaea thermarum]|nr:hypothetical protein EJ110_NYTH20904 [Nymphaea thermarum]